MLGLCGEICYDTLYSNLLYVGHPFWNYTVYPIYHAYTSLYAIILWGIYGFLLYLQHDTFKKLQRASIHKLALIFSLEAIPIEMLVNITYKLSFGHYLYYYFPSDLWHLSSIQTLPFYFVAGYVVTQTFRKFETRMTMYTCLSIVVVGALAYLR